MATTKYEWGRRRAYRERTTASGSLSHGDRPRQYGTAREEWSLWYSLKAAYLLHSNDPSAVGRHRAAIREKLPNVKQLHAVRQMEKAKSTHVTKAAPWFKS